MPSQGTPTTSGIGRENVSSYASGIAPSQQFAIAPIGPYQAPRFESLTDGKPIIFERTNIIISRTYSGIGDDHESRHN